MKKTGVEISGGKKRKTHWKFVATAFSAGVGLFVSGCGSLAREDVRDSVPDKMIGYFLTEEPVFTEENQREGVPGTDKNTRSLHRLYAAVGDVSLSEPVRFENLEGYVIYAARLWNESGQSYEEYRKWDDVFSEPSFTRPEGREQVEAVVYMGENAPEVLYFNQIYQTADGLIYLRPDLPLVRDGFAEGNAQRRGMTTERYIKRNGEVHTETSSFLVRVVDRPAWEDVRLLVMDGENRVIEEYSRENLRERAAQADAVLRVPGEAAYLILEQLSYRGEVERGFCDRGCERIQWVEENGRGFLCEMGLALEWESL